MERHLDVEAGLVERLIDGRAPLDLDHLRRILLLAGVPPVRFLARFFHHEATMPSREDVAELVGRASSALEEVRCGASEMEPPEGGSPSPTEGER